MDIDAEPTSSQPNIGLNNADVYIVADKYDIQPLEALAATKITNWAQINAKSLGFFRHGTSYSAVGARSLALQVHRRMYRLPAPCQVLWQRRGHESHA
ncbi:hypothetical protein PENSUB_7577 [Penicillium subrubescens]|uniref:Uncharacterized protein n=1 Tax=Penicillium subrubescens TaxID=1316194 RepID=A0A1Q5TL95_9EURO|nr:hypothetical protein PENSUB_7577 [Penicillium subrubescens]